MSDAEGFSHALSLAVLPEILAICQLSEGSPLPDWMPTAGFRAYLHTPGEMTLVFEQRYVPPGVKYNPGWKAIEIQGPLDFSLVGVLASLASPLADAGVSIFALSTFNTDYVLVKEKSLEKARQALHAAGHTFIAR